MKTIHFKIARLLTWLLIIVLFLYIFVTALQQPSRAELMSASQGYLVYMSILWTNAYALVASVVLLIIAFASVIIRFTMRKMLSESLKDTLNCLCEFIFAASIWVLTDSHFLSFVTAKTSTVALISYLSFTTMFAFLFEFISYMMDGNTHLNILCIVLYCIAVAQIIYFIHPFVPAAVIIVPVHVICMLGAATVVYAGMFNKEKKQREELNGIVQGFICLLACGIVAMVSYYVDRKIRYTLFYSLGICIFCAFLIIVALKTVMRQIKDEASETAYRQLAYTDVMTGLMNKSAYIEEENKPLTYGCVYLMIDINNLKKINDQYGHRMGDEIIIQAAGYVREFFEKGLCFRFGGDEFIVICRDFSLDEIQCLISAMRAKMEEDNRHREIPVQIAVGYSVYQRGDTADQMFQRADRAMYEDKQRQKAIRN